MKTVLDIFVRGRPVGQPRQRFRAVPARDGSGRPIFKHGHRLYIAQAYHDVEVNTECDKWKEDIRRHVRSSMVMGEPITVPVRADLFFFMPRTANLRRPSAPFGEIPHTQKPDIDNLAKAVLDALTTVWTVGEDKVGIWDDDKRVVGGELWKHYHAKPKVPGVWITVETLEEPEPSLFKEKETPIHPGKLLSGRPQLVGGLAERPGAL